MNNIKEYSHGQVAHRSVLGMNIPQLQEEKLNPGVAHPF